MIKKYVVLSDCSCELTWRITNGYCWRHGIQRHVSH